MHVSEGDGRYVTNAFKVLIDTLVPHTFALRTSLPYATIKTGTKQNAAVQKDDRYTPLPILKGKVGANNTMVAQVIIVYDLMCYQEGFPNAEKTQLNLRNKRHGTVPRSCTWPSSMPT